LPFYPSELPESEMETEKNVQELDCILIAGLSNAMRKLQSTTPMMHMLLSCSVYPKASIVLLCSILDIC
jgi:hypothetical protein